MSLDFRDGLSAGAVEDVTTGMERAVKSAHPDVKRIFIEAQRRGHHDGQFAPAPAH